VATAGNAQASVTFTAPVSNGGSAITGYTVTSSPGGVTATGASSPLVVTGLTNGTAYTFSVVATNVAGNSVASVASTSVTPTATVPGAPTSPVATPGNAQASVAFVPPVSNGGSAITSYTVTSTPGNFTVTGASSPLVVAGLTNGTSYTFRVISTNAIGNSAASSASVAVTPRTVPDAPPGILASPFNAQVNVNFTIPSNNGGSVITSYTATSSPGNFTATGASSPLIVTGLTNGTSYTFRVFATNAAGNGPSSVASAAVIPRTVPGAPTSPVATPGNAQASVTFVPPVSNGGSAITSYTVTSTPGNITATGASSPIVVTGLANGTSYTFRVVATTIYGNSVASAATASVTTWNVPGAPTSPVATVNNASQVTVAFTAPVNNGGGAITSYTVTSSPGGVTATGANSPIVVTGLPIGTSYTFTVVATNVVGNSVPSVSTIATTGCGAFVAAGVWKEFMCHNLGADTALNPNIPVQGIHGNYYQWGNSAVVANAYTPNGNITGYSTVTAADGALNDTTKTSNDPCPSGYRIPTIAQWNYIASSPTINFVSRTGVSWNSNETVFGNAIHFGPSAGAKTLTLPAAGTRYFLNGGIFNRAFYGIYWSSTMATSPNAYYFEFRGSGSINQNLNWNRRYGGSIRCIKI
jgi:uncharacterized protein (TIGR02145 family)